MASLLLQGGSISVFDYRCNAGPADKPFAELHDRFTVSYVRKGSFGYHARGQSFELSPSLVDALGIAKEFWLTGGIPPLAELMVLGELAQAAAEGRRTLGLDELGMLFTARSAEIVGGRKQNPLAVAARDRQRMVETALWIDANSHEPIDLDGAAAVAGLSSFHFLRLFKEVLG